MKEKLLQQGNSKICPIAIVVKNGKILRGLRNYSETLSLWSAPGGRCEEGETIEGALRREVFEETIISDLEIIDFIDEVPGTNEGDVVPIFYCTTKQEAKLMEPEKFSEWRWVSIEDFIADDIWGEMNLEVYGCVCEYIRVKGV